MDDLRRGAVTDGELRRDQIRELRQPPVVTLRLLLIALSAGVLLLLPSFWYLFRVFGAQNRIGQLTTSRDSINED